MILVNHFRNPDLYCNFGDSFSLLKILCQIILPRAFSSFQKAWLDRAELFKTRGSRAKFRAEPRLDTPLAISIPEFFQRMFTQAFVGFDVYQFDEFITEFFIETSGIPEN